MRNTVSKCITNCHLGPLLPPRMSYRINNTPSGWQFFLFDICPDRHRFPNPFRHLRRPTSLLLSFRISSAVVSISVVLHLCQHACPSLYSPLTLSAISIILEQRYALRLVFFPCKYFPCPSPPFQTIFPSLSSHISSVAVSHLLRRHIHPSCPASLPPCLSSNVFTTDLVCHHYYSSSPPRLHCYPPASLLWSSSHYLPSFVVLFRSCLFTFSDRIFSSLCAVLY